MMDIYFKFKIKKPFSTSYMRHYNIKVKEQDCCFCKYTASRSIGSEYRFLYKYDGLRTAYINFEEYLDLPQ